MSNQVTIGVDVGTVSVRAGVFTLTGKMLGTSSLPIKENHPKEDFYEQSSADIWEQTGKVVRKALVESGRSSTDVIGLSYDATCSLVALDKDQKPVTVSESGEDSWNIIVWRDHRAIDQVTRINGGGYDVLRYVGGIMSPEQEPPKLLWLKENLPNAWSRTAKFFDLADFMVYQSTGQDLRSLCTNVCKWTYLGHESKWDQSFFDAVGIGDLFEEGRVTNEIAPMGENAGQLTQEAADHLGLSTNSIVGVGIIDAHAGGIGLAVDESSLALIGGTSSCHMAVSPESRFVDGVWGPYFGAMVPGKWLNEGGQSATGALLDHTIERYGTIKDGDNLTHVLDGKDINSVHAELNAFIANQGVGPEYTERIHILPYHHGNRSPNADPNARGIVDGLTLDMSYETLVRLYCATIQSIAYGTRHIIDSLEEKGYKIDRIKACGGGTKNALWIQTHADATQRAIELPEEPEAVLLGAAILGAVAGGAYESIEAAMGEMCRAGEVIEPEAGSRGYHDWKYERQLGMYAEHLKRRESHYA
ncbi:MAG: FGGY-family carbohydrate kinase [Candidatus Latescibacterota bacterium]|nr:FGGY-family carbohydrate kinase [Candidatus Latescibacterota bacterium]